MEPLTASFSDLRLEDSQVALKQVLPDGYWVPQVGRKECRRWARWVHENPPPTKKKKKTSNNQGLLGNQVLPGLVPRVA